MSSMRRAAIRLQEGTGIDFEVRDIRRTVASGMTEQVILKGRGRQIALQAVSTPRTYEGWTRWASVGRSPKRRETWAERRDRLAAEGRDLAAEYREQQASLRQRRRDQSQRGADDA